LTGEFANSHWVRDEAHFDELIARKFDDGGPVLLAAKINDKPGTAQTPRDPALIRHRFMQGLDTGRASALDGWRSRGSPPVVMRGPPT
jgi:hypothetical protein